MDLEKTEIEKRKKNLVECIKKEEEEEEEEEAYFFV